MEAYSGQTTHGGLQWADDTWRLTVDRRHMEAYSRQTTHGGDLSNKCSLDPIERENKVLKKLPLREYKIPMYRYL